MPNAPRTPQRSIRISDEEWLAAQAVAERRGEDVSAVIRTALRRYVRRNQNAAPDADGAPATRISNAR